MTYQVLARKWRPKNFAEVVGQPHVVQALVNAFEQQRLHHAYLFTGTRGVGKTTLARIVAKCLNCEQGITATPCEQCPSCTEINTGCSVDVLEVDAASRTKVEETRELLHNVPYAPAKSRYKVYLIDEVHMLSTHSFNALLKTLEEPPAHVIFILATTEPDRIPATVRSRCLQFYLGSITVNDIAQHLQTIVDADNIAYEQAALIALAKAAAGSLRDALSLLDQALAYNHQCLQLSAIHALLGTVEQSLLANLLFALVAQDAQQLLSLTAQLAEQATDFQQALTALLSLLHQIVLAHHLPINANPVLEEQQIIATLAQQITPEDAQLYYQIGLLGRRDLAWAPTLQSGFEMTLLRMLTFRPAQQSVVATVKKPLPTLPVTPTTVTPPMNPMIKPSAAAITASSPAVAPPPPPQNLTPVMAASWAETVSQLKLSGLTQLLANYCVLTDQTPDAVHLLLDASQTAVCNSTQQQRIADALSAHYGRPITVTITPATSPIDCPARMAEQQHKAQLTKINTQITEDPQIQTIITQFNGKIELNSIKLGSVDNALDCKQALIDNSDTR